MYYDTGNYHNLYLFMDYRPYFRKKEFACRLDEILFWAFLHGLPVDFQPDSSAKVRGFRVQDRPEGWRRQK
jgi:hypothetical protein